MPRRHAADEPRIFVRTTTSLVPEKAVRDMIPALQHQISRDVETARRVLSRSSS